MTPFLLFCLVPLVSSVKLPSYWKTCKRNDPKVDECIKEAAQSIVSGIALKGNKELEVPQLEPFRFEKMEVKQGQGSIAINLTFTDLDSYGIGSIAIDSVKWDWDKGHIVIKYHYRKPSTFLGKYTIKGKVLLLPVVGSGDSNMTITDPVVTLEFFTQKENRNGKEYLKIVDSKMTSKVSRLYIHLDNLFNGDKTLGKQMNTFLNENWELVMEDTGTSMMNAMSAAMSSVLNRALSKLTADEVFPAS